MRVTVIDNFDSFTYNLVQALAVLGAEVTVYRNDARTPAQVLAESPDRILISPGPGGPADAGISLALLGACLREAEQGAATIPLLGVCLGHQCLAAALGAEIQRVAPVHGKTSAIHHDGRGLFADLPAPFVAARYHSLAVAPQSLPPGLEISARTEDGIIMGLRHARLPLFGVQFHPESFMTPAGPRLLATFLSPAAEEGAARDQRPPRSIGAADPFRAQEPLAARAAQERLH